jgi:RNA polymerase sigma-70 factor (ECF subfamily)
MTDEVVMESIKDGDLQQTSVLFERYHKRIFNFLALLTHDRALAEDLTQNVFLRIIRYRNSYKNGLRFQSWIYQIARNVFSDHYQVNKKKLAEFIDVEKVSDILPDMEESEERCEREKLLHQSLDKLNAEQRELLLLTRFQELKYEEVAVIMNTTVSNIKVKVHRAIAKLREHYFELERN